MAKPSSKQGLVDYALRQNGAPVLEINIEDDQLDDLVDDAIQYLNERNSDGYIRTHVKIKWSEAMRENMVTDNTTTIADGTSNSLAVSYLEQNNYVKMPEHVPSVIKVFHSYLRM